MDKKFVSIFLIIAFMIFPLCVSAAKGVPTRDEVQLCLMCHQDKGLTKKLENKERLSLYIDGNQFMTSVHRKVKCTRCHNDISMDAYPRVKTINSKREYSERMYKKCRICHYNECEKPDERDAEIERLREALEFVLEAARWHFDGDADPKNESPEDMTAHINGLIVKRVREALGD